MAASKDTATSAQRVTNRVEEALDEIEEPIRALRPGLERLAVTLDSPVIDRLPATLEAIESTVLPIAESMQRMRDRWAAAKDRGRRAIAPMRNRIERR